MNNGQKKDGQQKPGQYNDKDCYKQQKPETQKGDDCCSREGQRRKGDSCDCGCECCG